MKFFIDTANVEDIKKANDMGVICGVTQSSESSFIRRDQDECDPDLYGKPGTACGKSRGILCIPIPWKTG